MRLPASRFKLRFASVVCVWLMAMVAIGHANQQPQTKAPATPVRRAAPSPAAKPADAGMTNADVIKMVTAGLSEQTIATSIRQATKRSFDLSPDGLIQLKTSGVPDSIMSVMLDPTAALVASTPSPSPNSSAPSAGVQPAVKPAEIETSAGPQKTVNTPDGERVALILMEDLSSATAQQGDRVNFSVADDVKVGDALVIAKGATAVGSVTSAKKKGMLGQGGKLTISIDQVKAVDGQNIRMRATSGREGDDKLGKTVAIAVLAGPFALLVKGKDITAPKGQAFSAYIDETKEIIGR